MTQQPSIRLIGSGVLADLLSARLARRSIAFEHVPVVPDDPAAAGVSPDDGVLHVTITDGWMPRVTRAWLETRARWLRIEVSPGRAMIGPVTTPGTPGCAACVDRRLLTNPKDRAENQRLHAVMAERGQAMRNPGAATPIYSLLADVAADELARFADSRPMRTQDRVFLAKLDSAEAGFFRFLPDSTCPTCANRPEDTDADAVIVLQPRIKEDPTSYRVRSSESLRKALEQRYMPGPAGIFDHSYFGVDNPYAVCSVSIPLRLAHNEVGVGRTFTFQGSRATAFLEGLERYAGWHSGGKRVSVRAPYEQIADRAVDPTTLGHHFDDSYAAPGFPFKRFDPKQTESWAWGYSFRKERPLLVPAKYAHYGLQYEDLQDRGIVYEISNGCALGSVLEEAILYGILELVERDAFLMTWYARLPLPEIDLGSCQDRELQLMLERLQTATGYQVRVFKATLDVGIPCVWAMASNQRPGGAAVVCAGGAHLDPARAIKSTLHELAGTIVSMETHYQSFRPAALQMLEEPLKVMQMEDHARTNCLPEAASRFDFIAAQARPRLALADAFPDAPGPAADLTDDLRWAVRRVLDAGLDVIAVDQTSPELQVEGLRCVKVIVPGMLPMTFGHRMRRVLGLPRLLQLPATLGFRERPLELADINPYPHPFP